MQFIFALLHGIAEMISNSIAFHLTLLHIEPSNIFFKIPHIIQSIVNFIR
ncbi:hypothetical protein AKUA2001_14960 [Apilactobacillus kunkeei]|nr:hypothetical protein [Apilactobacillus kunkeei]CAI2665369.1 hypothetical protein AKUA2101_14330 [Apilactobacillus kunkeei]CAI2668443.1 hypothetical protein AKUA1805_14320 [Apilactobacillus kunkeei]CAI2669390.1 hypothetical protein AKUA0901_14830 [Apilactobacillus kunkeei]CAI2670489.1 hypothetical protein AKUA1802_14840 [Apilactobacillus kunkeei]CAI2672115.1 hypothetical protein AKUA1201_14820 [Apilactobacillus kunkeei]